MLLDHHGVLSGILESQHRETPDERPPVERLEVVGTGHEDGDVGIVGHPCRASVEKQLRHKSPHDPERNAELPEPTGEVVEDR